MYYLEGVDTLNFVKKVAFYKINKWVWRKPAKSGLFLKIKIADFPVKRQFPCS